MQKNEKAVQQARLQREKRGVVYLVDQWEEQLNNTVSSGATSATVQLNTFKGGATEIMFVVRAATSDDATAANLGNDPFDYVKITSWELKTGQITLVDLVTDAEQKHVLNRKMHSGVPGDHIYGASWSAHPEDPMNAWGHITFAGMAYLCESCAVEISPKVQQQCEMLAEIDRRNSNNNNVNNG